MLLLTKNAYQWGEVNRKTWSSEKYAQGVGRRSIREMETFTTVSRTINARTVDASLSNALSNISSRTTQRALIERLLVERISLRGICRAVGVRLKWLLGFLIHLR